MGQARRSSYHTKVLGMEVRSLIELMGGGGRADSTIKVGATPKSKLAAPQVHARMRCAMCSKGWVGAAP